MPDYEKHLRGLREKYVEQTPWQRSGAGWQRLTFPNSEPNLLVTVVSVVEGLARSLVLQQRDLAQPKGAARPTKRQIYAKVRNTGPTSLLEEVAASLRSEERRVGKEC